MNKSIKNRIAQKQWGQFFEETKWLMLGIFILILIF